MLTYIKRLTDERDSLTATVVGLTDTAAREERDVTETERASIASMETRCASIDAQLQTYNAQAESQRAYAQLRAAATTVENASETGTEIELRPRTAVATVNESWLAPITRSAEFAAFEANGKWSVPECHTLRYGQTRASRRRPRFCS